MPLEINRRNFIKAMGAGTASLSPSFRALAAALDRGETLNERIARYRTNVVGLSDPRTVATQTSSDLDGQVENLIAEYDRQVAGLTKEYHTIQSMIAQDNARLMGTLSQGEFLATLVMEALEGTTPYTDTIYFGTANGATRNYDINHDLLDPGAPPAGKAIDGYFEPDDLSEFLVRSLIGASGTDKSFRGCFEFLRGLNPDSLKFTMADLPDDYVGTLLTFADSNFTLPAAGAYVIQNGVPVEVDKNAPYFQITEKPVMEVELQNGNKIKLTAMFNNFDAFQELNAGISTNLLTDTTFTNQLVSLYLQGQGIYTNDLPLIGKQQFYRININPQ